MPFNILIVENDSFIMDLVIKSLKNLEKFGEEIHIIPAFTLSQGFYAFNNVGKDIFCSILGGQLDLYTTTLPLAKEMNENGFPATRISFSGNPELQRQQMEAGCVNKFDKGEIEKMATFIEEQILIKEKKLSKT
ncbi:MAG: hypothetical protein WC447_01150 [Candidatus Paceibacterota bacterium]|jgi:hypothetical protein